MNCASELQLLVETTRRLRAANFSTRAALATITRTRGPTYRRAGAKMLIDERGKVTCALAGGCPQRDIVLRAQRVIAADKPALVRYDRDSGLDVLIEAGCGGELEVLVEPLSRDVDLGFLEALAQCQADRVEAFAATLFASAGEAFAPRPQRLLWAEATYWTDIEDQTLQRAIQDQATTRLGTAQALTTQFDEGSHSFDVLLERISPVHALTIVGANEGAMALARLALALNWSVCIVDDRDAIELDIHAPHGATYLRATPHRIAELIALDSHASAIVMTHNLERDLTYLQQLRSTPLAYLGAIGSRPRTERMQQVLGVGPRKLYAPAGLDIGADTPEEIAVAVIAEIIAASNGRRGGLLIDASTPLH